MDLVFDVETNGYLEQTTMLHCLVLKDTATKQVWSCTHAHNVQADREGITRASIEEGLDLLSRADKLIGHNIVKFDIPAIQKVYPDWHYKAVLRDTLLLSRVVWSDIKTGDFERIKKHKLPAKFLGRYSLEAWGYRIGNYKGDYEGGFDTWNQEMQDYCVQDVSVTETLWFRIVNLVSKYSRTDFVQLEHDVQVIIARQEARGVYFDVAAAEKLYGTLLGKRHEIGSALQAVFAPWFRRGDYFVPKQDNKRFGYMADCPLNKVSLEPFNPQSREDVANRLIKLHGWQPEEYGKDGKPTVDDDILQRLPYPEAPLLSEYFMVCKRIATLAEGQEALLKHQKNGAIHGQVITNGAVTGRMTHMKPNMNIPKVETPYGPEMRALFIARPGYKLVGCDADALEARVMAGYMAPYDMGEYIKITLEGDKKIGTDTHSMNAHALGLDPKKLYSFDGKMRSGREIAKTWFYAFIYGAQDPKLGFELGVRGTKAQQQAAGRAGRASVLRKVPALAKLVDAVTAKIKANGYLVGLDGRRLPIRKANAALNALFQGAGAILMKRALVILDKRLQEAGLIAGKDYEFVLNVHDEWQIEVLDRDNLPQWVGAQAEDAIRDAGLHYNFICPLAGNAKIGDDWKETH